MHMGMVRSVINLRLAASSGWVACRWIVWGGASIAQGAHCKSEPTSVPSAQCLLSLRDRKKEYIHLHW